MTEVKQVSDEKLVELARCLVKDYVLDCMACCWGSQEHPALMSDFADRWCRTLTLSEAQKSMIKHIAYHFKDNDLEDVILRGKL